MTEPRFVAKTFSDRIGQYVVWDTLKNCQHDPVPYTTLQAARDRANLAEQAANGELDHLRDPRAVAD
jgi:hypothetical protein